MARSRIYRGEDALEAAERDAAKGERFATEADSWIEDNPQAWEFMKASAREAAQVGFAFGVGELCEHIRWHMKANGSSSFKLNNNHRARFARRLIAEVPECRPYIKTRDSVVDL